MPTIPSSICEDTSAVKICGQSQSSSVGRGRGKGRGRGRGKGNGLVRGYFRSAATAMEGRGIGTQETSETQQTVGYKAPRHSGYGVYQDTMSGRIVMNPGNPFERVIAPGTYMDASAADIDLGFTPNDLKWKGKKAVTTF
ncbi:uncharacterized protein LOC107777125 [Nicotiana tabacum]|uniref:Uncharacterized protein LOC107777125 n=1 Tax=Nicotiana tabacum TaxID=4097 RepID=A0A1S3YKM8_TOBAC|nr:PREDICTED: uncharacterized protein LOC107777125 [Nicotiana tabacum]